MSGQGVPAAAFITGGSSGIGFELALALAAEAHPVAIIARDGARLQDALERIRAVVPGAVVAGFSADVSDRAACEAAVARAIDAFGPPGWAIAAAGIAEPGEFLRQAAESHAAQIGTDYMGSLWFARAVASPMVQNGGGRLVFVSSGAAFFGIYGYSAYAPAKFAVRGLAEVLRVELAPRGISVTLAYPPDTDTPQLRAEAATKPAITKEITAGGGLWQAADVARIIIARARKGRFAAAPGGQMRALLVLHSLIAPLLRRWQARIVRRHMRRS